MSTGYRKLAEGARNLIISYLQANLPTALNVVAAAQPGNPAVSLENVRHYYIYEKSKALDCPVLFVICDSIDFRIQEKKSNFLNAKDRFRISVLVEDQDTARLTVKADRYLSALHQTLDKVDINSTDGTLSLRSVVYRASFSPIFSRKEVNDATGDGGHFRRECVLECEIEHYEAN
jgi:hypothetical protein